MKTGRVRNEDGYFINAVENRMLITGNQLDESD